MSEAAESVTKYLRDNDIGRDDFLLLLELGAAMRRGDFQAFYAGVRPYMDLAEQYLGLQLPPDLQQRVQQGHMTTEAAKLFSRERMDRALAQGQAMRHATINASTSQQNAQTALANAVADKVNAWERATAAADADYGAKQAAVQNMMWSVVRQVGAPQTPEQAVAIAQEAYKRVNDQYKAWVGAGSPRRPTSRQPSSTGRINGAAPEPKNLAEAIGQARASFQAGAR